MPPYRKPAVEPNTSFDHIPLFAPDRKHEDLMFTGSGDDVIFYDDIFEMPVYKWLKAGATLSLYKTKKVWGSLYFKLSGYPPNIVKYGSSLLWELWMQIEKIVDSGLMTEEWEIGIEAENITHYILKSSRYEATPEQRHQLDVMFIEQGSAKKAIEDEFARQRFEAVQAHNHTSELQLSEVLAAMGVDPVTEVF